VLAAIPQDGGLGQNSLKPPALPADTYGLRNLKASLALLNWRRAVAFWLFPLPCHLPKRNSVRHMALGEVATAALPETILAWYRRLVARKFDGSRARRTPGRPRIEGEAGALLRAG
jgi:hypothetical protein